MSSDQLTWLLLRKWTSFTIKGQGTPVFTREPGNLQNVHSPVYSGLLSGAVHVKQSKNGDFTINHRKQDASHHHVAEGRESQPVKRKAGLHRAVQTAVGSAKSSERPELSRLAAARVYNLSSSQRVRHRRKKAAPAAAETKTEA
ncbi:hypothetical protein FRC04_007428 [Tulasnella sp. 424]|nr:hypothetical protein FRC04_007428 [Tulasnella sp. 424]KAG8975123.1 hypothetical protein FRC05_006291 [Tulasnella sp. 425]